MSRLRKLSLTKSPPHGGADRNLLNREAPGGQPLGRPLTGARIETPPSDGKGVKTGRSPPHGGADRNARLVETKSRRPAVAPSRGRGSKHVRTGMAQYHGHGRPLTGARIETMLRRSSAAGWLSPPHGGADRNRSVEVQSNAPTAVAPSRGRGSKPKLAVDAVGRVKSPPHGGADRNSACTIVVRSRSSRPLTGARIETFARPYARARRRGSPPHGGADRNCIRG